MVATVSDMVLSVGYLLLWIVTWVVYQRRRNVFDGGSAIMLSYICYAVFSIITINDELFSNLESVRAVEAFSLYISLSHADDSFVAGRLPSFASGYGDRGTAHTHVETDGMAHLFLCTVPGSGYCE